MMRPVLDNPLQRGDDRARAEVSPEAAHETINLLEGLMEIDPYAALGLSKTASADEIRKAYRKLARSSHPDLHPDDPDAESRFKSMSAAYDLLKDPETRARFDAGEIDASGAERPQRKYYRDFAGAERNPYQQGRGFEAQGDPEEIFAEFLRQRARPQGYGRQEYREEGFAVPGSDARYSLEVPFLDAVRGTRTRITLPGGGNLDVTIPAGTADGQTLRLRGKGSPGFGGGPPGDALITSSVWSHDFLRRDGNDIVVTLPITIDEAILGGKVAVPTIDGPVNLTIPPGASSGRILRLRGRGAKPQGKTPGDQLVELRIVAPPVIDEELRTFLQEWRKSNVHDPRKGLTEGGTR